MGRRTGAVNRDDEELLGHFLRVVASLADRRAIKEQTLAGSIQLSWNSTDNQLMVNDRIGDLEDLRSLMIDFRKLRLENEPSNFLKTTNVVARLTKSNNASLFEENKAARVAWQENMRGDIQIDVNGTEARGQKLLDLWLNGVLFHSTDDAGRKMFADLHRTPFGNVALLAVQGLVVQGIRIAFFEHQIVERVFEMGLAD